MAVGDSLLGNSQRGFNRAPNPKCSCGTFVTAPGIIVFICLLILMISAVVCLVCATTCLTESPRQSFIPNTQHLFQIGSSMESKSKQGWLHGNLSVRDTVSITPSFPSSSEKCMLMGMFIKCHSGFKTDGGTDSFLHTMVSSGGAKNTVRPLTLSTVCRALVRDFVWSDYTVVFFKTRFD